ncbi:MAG: hypothetical protein OXC40_05890 [Proteobacteria bacterium]|nr:hypothetical protein [Pseudomonadota bacterium]
MGRDVFSMAVFSQQGLYPHKMEALEQAKSSAEMAYPWLFIEGEGLGIGTSFFLKYLYSTMTQQGYQGLYVESAPRVESSYPISVKMTKLFNTKADLKQKTAFHQAIELLRLYNFSPLYIFCDLSSADSASFRKLITEAQFLWRHSSKNHLRFIFAKNQPFAHEHGEDFLQNLAGESLWQVIKIPQPSIDDVGQHISHFFQWQNKEKKSQSDQLNHEFNQSFYHWIFERLGGNFNHISEVCSYVIKVARDSGQEIDSFFAQKQAQEYLQQNRGSTGASFSAA